MTIKLKDITPAPWNTRGEITEESVAELAASIKEQGLINPITIWLKGELPNNIEARYCIAGNRRLAALLSIYGGKADLKQSWYTFFDGTEHEAKMITVTENLQREGVSPLEEAALVEQCMEDGMTAESIAAKTGRSTSWVNRRRKLITLDDAWKDRAAKIDTDALEKIASYPPAIQKKVAKAAGETMTSWKMLGGIFEREARDLDEAKFDTKMCRACEYRTGAQADLFGECDGKLGLCMNAKCFCEKRTAFEDAEIARLTKGAEVVRLDYAWQIPQGVTDKRDKAHPCAYIYRDYTDSLVIKWGASKAEIDAAKKREEESRAVERAEKDARRERIDSISEALEDWKRDTDENEWPRGLEDMVRSVINDDAQKHTIDFVLDCVRESICGWHSDYEWANIIRAFPQIIKRAGVSDEDRDYFIGEFAEDEEGKDEI